MEIDVETDVVWSAPWSLSSFCEAHSGDLPQIIKLEEGTDSELGFCLGDIFLVTEVPDVTVKAQNVSHHNRLMNLDPGSSQEYRLLDNTGKETGQIGTLRELLGRCKLPFRVKTMTQTKGIPKKSTVLQILSIQLKAGCNGFIQANLISMGTTHPACTIPLDVDVPVRVATGPKSAEITGEDWTSYKMSLMIPDTLPRETPVTEEKCNVSKPRARRPVPLPPAKPVTSSAIQLQARSSLEEQWTSEQEEELYLEPQSTQKNPQPDEEYVDIPTTPTSMGFVPKPRTAKKLAMVSVSDTETRSEGQDGYEPVLVRTQDQLPVARSARRQPQPRVAESDGRVKRDGAPLALPPRSTSNEQNKTQKSRPPRALPNPPEAINRELTKRQANTAKETSNKKDTLEGNLITTAKKGNLYVDTEVNKTGQNDGKQTEGLLTPTHTLPGEEDEEQIPGHEYEIIQFTNDEPKPLPRAQTRPRLPPDRRPDQSIQHETPERNMGGDRSGRPVPRVRRSRTDQELVSWDDVPNDLTNLTVDQVGDCLKLLRLSAYTETFKEYQVDGRFLVNLSSEEMVDMGLKTVCAKKIRLFTEKGWRPNVSAV